MEIKSYSNGMEERICYDDDEKIYSKVRSLPRGNKIVPDFGELLTLKEIVHKLDLLKTELVVLSACETGLIDISSKSDEFVGLPGGFMQAGARNVVASMWAVDDLSTSLFMAEFYRLMIEDGLSPSSALQKTQLKFIIQGKWKNPYYWGAFKILGP